MAERLARDRVNPSAGGARAAGGLMFQAQVFARWAALAVSDDNPGLGLNPQVRIEAVGCETGFSVDDVGVALSDGGFILVQAKGGLRRLDPGAQDLRSAIDQLVTAMIGGLRADVAMRPVDIARDRLVIATNQDSSRSFHTLGTVCARLRDLPLGAPLDMAAANESERTAFRVLLRIVQTAWLAADGHVPAEGDLRRLFRVIEVSRFDFETDVGADLVRCEALLQNASVPQPFSVLAGIGIEAARSRTWRQRHVLMAAVGLGRSVQHGDESPADEAQGTHQPVTASGWLLAEVTDPFALEVHRPVQVDDPPPDLPMLPIYTPREHDRALADVVLAAAAGSSRIAVLVSGSSTGKTRACWEALALLRDLPQPWRIWHPIDPSRPEAALRELPFIGPRTVVWLNEAQFYLDVPGGLGERVAAGFRELVRDPRRGPVLILATMWPQFWDNLTTRPSAEQHDAHPQARELLSGRDITVPDAFTPAQIQMLAATADPRLAMAATARDGQVVQFLAGAPALLTRYRNAPPAAGALITAAIDGRRLGMGVALPLDFLESAAPGYLTEDQWDRLEVEWLGHALDYTGADCNGVRGPLTSTRPPTLMDGTSARAWRLADYLDQDGRQSRRSIIPPEQFWAAVGLFASVGDLGTLARAAESRGLLRDAARLRKRAMANGDTRAAAALMTGLHSLHLVDTEPASWAATNAALVDAGAVAWLLWALRKGRAADQVAALLARDPAARANLDDPHAIVRLLRELRRAGATGQAEALAARAAANANLEDPFAIVRLLQALRRAGADDQAAALASRAVAQANVDYSRAVARLLEELQEAGATDQTEALLARDPAGHANLNDARAIARLLQALKRAGANEQVTTLTTRAAANTTFNDPDVLASLLQELLRIGATDQVPALLARVRATEVNFDDTRAIARLLRELRRVGAADLVAALLARDPAANANLNDTRAIARLLFALRRAGAADQVAALLARDPVANANLKDAGAVARLLEALHEAGAADQVAALLARDPAANADLDQPRAVASLLEALRKVGGAEQGGALARRAAAHVSLDDAGALGTLLWALYWAGATDETEALLAREPATHAVLNDARAATRLMRALQRVGAVGQAEVLIQRLPAEGLFEIFRKQANNEMTYRFGREPEGSPASAWGWAGLD